MAQTGGRYGSALGVAVGWYLTLVAALALSQVTMPDPPPTTCDGFCLSPGVGLVVIGVLAAPYLCGLGVVLLVLLIPAARLIPSAIVAGTVAAAASALVGVVAVLALAHGGVGLGR